MIPVRVILRHWAAWSDEKNVRQPKAQSLWDFVQSEMRSHGLEDSFKPLREFLLERGGLILLDGLDEVPHAEERRELLKSVIEDFARVRSQCRVVVTCRPYV